MRVGSIDGRSPFFARPERRIGRGAPERGRAVASPHVGAELLRESPQSLEAVDIAAEERVRGEEHVLVHERLQKRREVADRLVDREGVRVGGVVQVGSNGVEDCVCRLVGDDVAR